MSKLKHVERIRARIVQGQVGELTRLRNYISLTDGNQEAVDLLRGDPGAMILAKVTDLLLKELGHETDTPVESAASKVRRDVSRLRGKARGAGTD